MTWKVVHILGVVGFAAAHGISGAVALRLRHTRDPVQLRALLDLSRASRPAMYASLLVLVLSGAISSSMLHVWTSAWILWSIGLLIAMTVIAMVLAVPYYAKVRRALDGDVDLVDTLLSSSRPLVIVWVETIGVVAIVWLMVAKPS